MPDRLLLIALVASLAGCVLGPDYQRPAIETPEQFEQRIAEGASIANLPWWQLFQDEQLQSLITVALEENKNLAIATARVEETRARLGFVRADQYPRLDGQAGVGRGNTAEQFIPGAGVQDENDHVVDIVSVLRDRWRLTRKDSHQLLKKQINIAV